MKKNYFYTSCVCAATATDFRLVCTNDINCRRLIYIIFSVTIKNHYMLFVFKFKYTFIGAKLFSTLSETWRHIGRRNKNLKDLNVSKIRDRLVLLRNGV